MAMSSEERRRRMHRAVGGSGSEKTARRPRKSYEELMDGIPELTAEEQQEASYERAARRVSSSRDLFGVMDQEESQSDTNIFEENASARASRRRSAEGTGRYSREDSFESPRRRRPAEAAEEDLFGLSEEEDGNAFESRRSAREESAASERVSRRRRSGSEAEERRSSRSLRSADGESLEGSRRSARSSRTERSARSREDGPGEGGGFDPRIIIMAVCVLIALLLLIFGIRAFAKRGAAKASSRAAESESQSVAESIEASIEESIEAEPETEAPDSVLKRASLMAAQYDYDGAIELLKTETDYDNNEEAQMAVAEYEEIKGTLVRQNVKEITHVFFHILMPDPSNALDESRWGKQAGGYNSLMTTVDEFNKMLQSFYDKGYVLVRIHDMAHIEKQADGTEKMVEGDIMLPPGKKAMVMSEDDVCYYEYMVGAAFADKMLVGEDGRPTTHIVKTDGTEDIGAYDLVPILDKFIDEHPDFSYKGGKAILAFTGYNGILGYRTDETYDPSFDKNAVGYGSAMTPNPNIEADRAEAVKVLKALVADGYELSSHSWGHRDMGAIEMSSFKTDCNRWEKNVNSLIKEATGEPCDIMIYPKGADVADWHGYSHSNERFDYMYKLGFRYFCNVDSSQYWVQVGDDYLRQGRRALDGLNMWLDIDGGKNRMSDLFDNVSEIFDPARPTPVPGYF